MCVLVIAMWTKCLLIVCCEKLSKTLKSLKKRTLLFYKMNCVIYCALILLAGPTPFWKTVFIIYPMGTKRNKIPFALSLSNHIQTYITITEFMVDLDGSYFWFGVMDRDTQAIIWGLFLFSVRYIAPRIKNTSENKQSRANVESKDSQSVFIAQIR